MKTIQATLATAWLTASLALAAPSEINYQGVLTDSQGNPVNGNQTMSLKIFDAATGGTLLYSENLGTVPVNNGVYNFTFGANGTSNTLTTETVATTNGTASTFQKVLSASTVVAGSVTVTDGNYTWDQTNGSSNENDFGVSYSTSLRRVTATYYNGAPAAGRTIEASYRTTASGIAGALAGNNQPWLETTINGTAQTPRQKILAVPFALNSFTSTTANKSLTPNYNVLLEPPVSSATGSATETSGLPQTFNIYSRVAYIPPDVDGLTLKVDASWQSEVWDGSRRPYILDVVVMIGSVSVYSFTFNGVAYNLNNFSFSKTLNAKSLGISTGFSTVTIQATKRDYGAGNNAVKINTQYNGGTCDLWLIGGPGT
jgi:hypothetical protein